MKQLSSVLAVIIFTIIVSLGGTIDEISGKKPIKFWLINQESNRQNYEFKLDETIYRSGSKSASIKSKPDYVESKTPGLLMQIIKADAFRGKRMRLSGFLRSENIEQGGLMFRIDGENMQVLGYDGMKNRFVKGSTEWSKYELVLEVPEAAQQITFGALLKGAGQIWIDDFSFEEVGREIPVTAEKPQDEQAKGSAAYIEIYRSKNKEAYENQLRAFEARNRTAPAAPANLNFESF